MTDTIEIMSVELVIVADLSIKIVQSIGSVLHGVLMELVGTDYAGQLHEAGLRPYNQYVYFDKDRTILEETSYEDLIHKFWSSDSLYTQAKLQCMSTTSFKVDKQYTIFPEAFRIYRYLLRQWNQFSTFGMLDTDSILGDLEAGVFIRDYNLRMGIYGLEGVKIRGFRGQVVMQFKRNVEMQRVLALLSYYSQFTGLGIKTALGMGGIKCEVIE